MGPSLPLCCCPEISLKPPLVLLPLARAQAVGCSFSPVALPAVALTTARGECAQVTFLTSKYRMAYGRTRCPDADAPDEVVKAVRVTVKEFARRHGLPEGATTAFLKELFSEWALHDQIADMGQKVWTSQKKLAGREFCSIVNELLRTDALLTDEVADQLAILAHAINRNVVTRSVEYDVPWPSGPKGGAGQISTMKDVCFRGGGFCDTAAIRDFFCAGRKYRVPGFLATSYNKYIAEHFIQRVRLPDLPRVVRRSHC